MGKEIKQCIIISGAPEDDIEYYKKYIDGRFVIAADSGFDKCRRLGISPDLVLGDFDSLGFVPDTECEIITLPVRKDDTDTAYASKEAVKRGFSDVIILGAIGSRFDHCCANVLDLNYLTENGVNAVIVSRNNEIHILDKPAVIERKDYKYFSLFALFDTCRSLTTRGSGYDLTDYDLAADSPLGQSNYFVSDEISVSFKKGKLLLILGND